MSFSPDDASQHATAQNEDERFDPLSFPHVSQPSEQPAERVVQPVRLQALFEGAASGAPVLGREGSSTAQPVSELPQEDSTWARDFDSFGLGPGPTMPTALAGIVQGTDAQSGSVENRLKHLTSVVQELQSLSLPALQPQAHNR